MNQIHLPTLNALLNFITTIFLTLGFIFIKKRQILFHRVCMGCATITSALFLSSYLVHHYLHGSTKFLGTGWIRSFYFSVLLSHTVLAALIVPMVLVTLYKALKGKFEDHARLARWTWPIWMYVSVTGIVIYWMLYR